MMLQDRASPSPESEDISTLSSRDNITVMTTRGRLLGRSAALQRMSSQQDRWRRQVCFSSSTVFLAANTNFAICRFKNSEGIFMISTLC